MYKNILDILRCPECSGKLELVEEKLEGEEIVEGKLTCGDNHNWLIREGVIDFESQEQESSNNWSEAYKEVDYEALDRMIAEKEPQNQQELVHKTCEYIVEEINKEKPNIVLDIASGRGALLQRVVKGINIDTNIIATDLSFQVLKYDRIKVKKLNPDIKATYIACDATQLPFSEGSIDMAISLMGIANMMNLAQDGVKAAKRVLKDDSRLLNSFIIIKNVDKANEIASMVREEHGVDINFDESYLTYEDVNNGHMKEKFTDVDMVIIGESIGQRNELDIIPLEGEWYASVVANCKK